MARPLDIKTFAFTDKGGRENNEDYFGYFWENGAGCWVAADGLGGHASGEVASRFVTESVINCAGTWESFSDEAIVKAMEGVNESLIREQSVSPFYKGMKSTLVAVFVEDGTLKYIHAGDSRMYYFRQNDIYARTKDHSMSQRAVDSGEIAYEDIRFHEDRNIVLKVMGLTNLSLTGYTGTITPEPGDAFLLCTDGFWEYVHETEMTKALAAADDPRQWLMDMLSVHITRIPANNDNFTAVCCMVK